MRQVVAVFARVSYGIAMPSRIWMSPVDVTCSQRLEDHSPTWPMYCKLQATLPNDAHRRWRLPEALQRLPGDQGSYLDEASKAFGVGESKRRRLRMSHAP